MDDATTAGPHSSISTPTTMSASENARHETISSEDHSTLPPLPEPLGVSGEKDPTNKKRKRTSPADHNTLEQEYKRNPKPDKAARIEIVQRVKLSEKEVQIWFQNKRQSARRKSRPLLPHEIASFGVGGMTALSSDPISSSLYGSSQPMSPRERSGSDISPLDTSEGFQEKEMKAMQHEQKVVKLEEDSFRAADVVRPLVQPDQPLVGTSSLEPTADTNDQESKAADEVSQPETKLSSMRASISRTSSYNPQLESLLSCSEKNDSSDNERPSSSRMRLSLSLEGRAELQEASPPRAHVPCLSSFGFGAAPRRAPRFQRSQSALPLGYNSSKISTSTRDPRLTTGRSRNARAWEFYAQNSTSNELGLPADHHDESSGSAVEAISLIRSASNNALKLNNNKRNASSAISEEKAVKKPKLLRASSSLARLQGSHKTVSIKPRSDKQTGNFTGSPTGDSDKENWIPGENGSEFRTFISTNSQAPKQVRHRLSEGNGNMPISLTKQAGRRNNRTKLAEKTPNIFEDEVVGENVDPEVEKFMRGEISPSKRGDLDCVQGLLSLSQGNWR